MKLWAFVFIALFRSSVLGATSSLVCGRGGAPRRRREAVLQLAVAEPSAPASKRCSAAALQNETTYAVGALRGNAAGRLSWVPHKMG